MEFVAGHYCSGSSIPASAGLHEEGVLQITPASTNPKFTDERRLEQRVPHLRPRRRSRATSPATTSPSIKDKKIAILHDKTAYGKGLADETKKALNAAGVKEAMYEAYHAGRARTYSALVTKLKQAGVDVDLCRRLPHRGRPDRAPGAASRA